MQLSDLHIIFFTGWFGRSNINDASDLLFYETDGLKGSKNVRLCVSYVISSFVKDQLIFIWLYQRLLSNMK